MIRGLLKRIKRRIWAHFLSQKIKGAISEVKRARLTYLTQSRLECLAMACARLERQQIQGCFLEAGCALGGSAIVITAAKKVERYLDVYDVFSMIPAPSAKDGPDIQARYKAIQEGKSQGIEGDQYYGYLDSLERRIAESFKQLGYPPEEHHVRFIKGLFQDTLYPDEPVGLAHIDGDWYESVMTCLARIMPKLSKGGVVIIDDYLDWSGCRRAVDEFFAQTRLGYRFSFSDGDKGSLLIENAK